MADAAMEISGLSKGFGAGEARVEVLREAELTVARGEIVALVAPSGAGKSTLLQIAGLLDAPDSGRVAIGGTQAAGLSDRARTLLRRDAIGFVYQMHHLLPEFDARENICIPQYGAGVAPGPARARADALLEAVGLSDRATHRPSALSGGERQRVAICRALANHPFLLLADEPTGNLDPATSDRVFDLLLRVAREEGAGALIATHNPDLAARMDRIVSLRDGRIVSE